MPSPRIAASRACARRTCRGCMRSVMVGSFMPRREQGAGSRERGVEWSGVEWWRQAGADKGPAPFPGPVRDAIRRASEALAVLHVIELPRGVVLRVEGVREGLERDRRILVEHVVDTDRDRAVPRQLVTDLYIVVGR